MGAVKEVFHLHGATPMASTGLGVAPLDFPADAVSMLAADGSPWGLRYDLRYPFAAWLARQAVLPSTSMSCCFCFCMCCAVLSSHVSCRPCSDPSIYLDYMCHVDHVRINPCTYPAKQLLTLMPQLPLSDC